jgi:iron complex transport system substrate-binding protein
MGSKPLFLLVSALLLSSAIGVYIYFTVSFKEGEEEHGDVYTDLLGREVRIPSKVERVAVGPGALRLIVYLNASELVVGVEEFEKKWPTGRPYILAHPELADLPVISPGGPGKTPNAEMMLQVDPDVIFATYIDEETAETLETQTNISVVVISYGPLASYYEEELFESLLLAGRVLGREERAKEVVGFVKEALEDLGNRTSECFQLETPGVYIGGIRYKGTQGIESTNCIFPPFEALNASNQAVETGCTGHVFIDKEKLLEWDPDVIFIDEGGLGSVKADYERNPQLYKSLKAFNEIEVYGVLPFNYYTTNIGTALADTYYIGKLLYPDCFGDVKPEMKADQIYRFLTGKPLYARMRDDFGGFGRIDLERGTIIYE